MIDPVQATDGRNNTHEMQTLRPRNTRTPNQGPSGASPPGANDGNLGQPGGVSTDTEQAVSPPDYENPIRSYCTTPQDVDTWVNNFATAHKQTKRIKYLRWAAHYEHDPNSVARNQDIPEDEKDVLLEPLKQTAPETTANSGATNSGTTENAATGTRAANPDPSASGGGNAVTTPRKQRRDDWSMQSRSIRSLVFVIGILSATCQGWYQSVVAGTIQDMVEDPDLGFDLLFGNFTQRFPGFTLNITKLRDQFPNQTMGRTDERIHYTMVSNMWRLGALTATPSLAAATSFLTADVLQHHVLARRGAVAFSALVSTIATIVLMFQNRFGPIIALRSVIGLSLGAKASIISPWLGELAPPRYRGRILATWQIGTSIGIFFGYVCWYIVDHYLGGTKQSPEIRWKIQSALPLITTIPLIFTAYMVPESYIYLLKTRKYKKAMESAHAYAPGKIKGYGNMITSHFQMISKTKDKNTLCPPQDRSTAERTDTNSGSTPGSHGSNDEGRRKAVRRLWKNVSGAVSDFRKEWDRGPNDCQHSYHRKDWDFYKRLFRVVIRSPRCRNAFISCGLVMVAQAAGGINAFALLSSLQIPSVGARGEQAAEQLWNRPTIWALSFGSVNCACSFFTLLVTDKWGRTTLVLIGLPLMAILMGILTVVFATVDDNLQDDNLQDLQGRTIGSWVVMLAFTAIYSISLGPAAFSFPAESFPSSVRESGMAACVALNMLSLGLQLLLYPIISSHIDYWKSLLIYTCVNIAAFILCFLFCVDTKNKSLDDLQYSFKQSLWHHARYRFYVLGRLLRLKFSSPDYEDWSRAQSSSN